MHESVQNIVLADCPECEVKRLHAVLDVKRYTHNRQTEGGKIEMMCQHCGEEHVKDLPLWMYQLQHSRAMPEEPGYYWFREVTNDEKKKWGIVKVIPTDRGLYSLRHNQYVRDVGDGKRWDPEWRGPISKPDEW